MTAAVVVALGCATLSVLAVTKWHRDDAAESPKDVANDASVELPTLRDPEAAWPKTLTAISEAACDGAEPTEAMNDGAEEYGIVWQGYCTSRTGLPAIIDIFDSQQAAETYVLGRACDPSKMDQEVLGPTWHVFAGEPTGEVRQALLEAGGERVVCS